jgi:hypothetical protein
MLWFYVKIMKETLFLVRYGTVLLTRVFSGSNLKWNDTTGSVTSITRKLRTLIGTVPIVISFRISDKYGMHFGIEKRGVRVDICLTGSMTMTKHKVHFEGIETGDKRDLNKKRVGNTM